MHLAKTQRCTSALDEGSTGELCYICDCSRRSYRDPWYVDAWVCDTAKDREIVAM